MAYGIYTFDRTPTIREMRAMAVQAQHDMLAVEWETDESFTFHKMNHDYVFRAGEHHAGLPYGSAQTTLAAFLEYLDENRHLKFDEIRTEGEELGTSVNRLLGNTCSGSTCWGLFTVCNSLRGRCVCYKLTPENGFFPVAPCTYDPSITDFQEKNTRTILRECGESVMLAAYANAQMGDLLLYQTADGGAGGHSVMLREDPTVLRLSDGAIDPENSFFVLQDQRFGFYEKERGDGEKILYNGRLSYRLTFAEALEKCYLPLTTAEFLGKKPYEFPAVSAEKDAAGIRITSNYPLGVVKVEAENADKNRERIYLKCFSREDIGSGEAFDFRLPPLETLAQSYRRRCPDARISLIAVLPDGLPRTLLEVCGA